MPDQLRLFWVGWLFHLKSLTQSSFFLLISILQPAIFASIAFFMFRTGQREGTLLYVALGAGLMGVWSSTLFGSGGAIQWQRWQGTLEVVIAAPAPFLLVMVPLTIATATVGLYSIVMTLLWGRVFFGVPLELVHPWLFALALPTMILGLGLLGLVMASTFVLYRNANAFSNLLEYPRLARHGAARPALAPARLGLADRLGPVADLGRARGARGGDRR